MFKSTKCPNCGGALQIPEEQTVLKCFYCGGEFFAENAPSSEPPSLPSTQNVSQPETVPQTSLRIDFAGVWLLVDRKVEVYFDNRLVGRGSLKNGFIFTVAVSGDGGAHVLELKMSLMSKRYDFMMPAGEKITAQINYSRAMGRFGSNLNFNHL